MFSKYRFKTLLAKAKGERSITEFAEETGVNRTYLSKYLNLQLDRPPKPEILKKIAVKAVNDVIYEELMNVAGYFPVENSRLKRFVDKEALKLTANKFKTRGGFNKSLFAELLKQAKGDRSINEYANETGVSSAHVSRLLRQLLDSAPEPATIKKLANKATNNVSYESMMSAAGHFMEKMSIEIFTENEIERIHELEKMEVRLLNYVHKLRDSIETDKQNNDPVWRIKQTFLDVFIDILGGE